MPRQFSQNGTGASLSEAAPAGFHFTGFVFSNMLAVPLLIYGTTPGDPSPLWTCPRCHRIFDCVSRSEIPLRMTPRTPMTRKRKTITALSTALRSPPDDNQKKI
jgi:hypothetical protein